MPPLRFHALVLETTDRCNARCSMCYQGAGPKGSSLRGDHQLPLDVALRVVGEALQVPGLSPRLHISGGEAFLRYQDVLAIGRHGRAHGFSNVGSTTNGFWAMTRSIAEQRCTELAEAGFTYFELSYDHWHLPYVQMRTIKNFLWATRRVGIPTVLRTLSTRSHHVDELLAGFSDEELSNMVVGNCPVYPAGHAASQVDPDDIYPGSGPVGACAALLNLTVSPSGNVYPCCAGADMTASLACGNVHDDTLLEAVRKMSTDRMIRRVIHDGTGALLPILEQLGLAAKLKPSYVNICHLCWDVFKDAELSDALRAYFDDEHLRDLRAFVAGLPEATPAAEPAALLDS